MCKHLTGASSTVIFGTLAGAGGAALTGGNVWQGAATGAIVAGLNHVAHISNKRYLSYKDIKKIYDSYPSNDPSSPDYVSIEDLYKSIGGALEEYFQKIMSNDNPNDDQFWINTCATRLSKALNDAGFTISSKTSGTWQGANGRFYIVNAEQMFNYLSKTYNFSSYQQGTTFLNGITAHSKDGNGIHHVDIFFNGSTKNSNFRFWPKHWIFYH